MTAPKPGKRVYFAERDGRIKIGVSRQVLGRVKEQHANLLVDIPGDEQVERSYHQAFAGCRRWGEWFEATPPLLALIESLKGTQGARTNGAEASSRTYSLREAGAVLGVSHETVRKLVRDGHIRAVALPGVRRTLIPASELERILEGRAAETDTSLRLVRGGKATTPARDAGVAVTSTAG